MAKKKVKKGSLKMIEDHHDLAHELPEYKENIHNLKMSDAHFAKLFKEYEGLNKEILRIEKGIETVTDEHLEDLKKKRLLLKDEMLNIITKAT